MTTKARATNSRFRGMEMPFETITEPGTYFCNWSGHLMRVPDEAVRQGQSPVIDIIGPETMYVTKLSDDPFIPLTKARMLAADLDHAVNF